MLSFGSALDLFRETGTGSVAGRGIIDIIPVAPALALTCSVAPAQTPLAPNTPTATTYSEKQITLAWTTPSSVSRPVQENDCADVTSWASSGLSAGTTARYQVRAYSVTGPLVLE